jgi:2-hydroxycyclohexanecarboxyl-CoA dehydrogenase
MDVGIAGKVALVTGAARGIGRAIAEALLREGASVALNDVRAAELRASLESLARQIPSASEAAIAIPGDITSIDDVERFVDQSERQLGPIEILVNNAGTWTLKSFVESRPADWASDLDVNLYGVINCTWAVTKRMVTRESGCVISITSDAGRVGEPKLSTYSAAKAGVIGLTRALAKELGPAGIRINCIALATTRTPRSQETFSDDEFEKMVRFYPLRRLGEPWDAAGAVLFLASDQASWVTGETLAVNGGYATV